MKKILTVLALALVMLALPMSAVYAQPTSVSGTVIHSIPSDYVCERAGDSNNVICIEKFYQTWTGDIAGTSREELKQEWILHDLVPCDECAPQYMLSPCMEGLCVCATAAFRCNFHELLTFDSPTVLGTQYPGDSLTIQSNVQTDKGGNWVIISGTGKLKNLHGNGTGAITPMDVPSPYTGQVHFDP